MTDTTKYKVGDTVTIMRGVDRGKTATVLDVDAAKDQYAVKFPDGSFSVVNAVNVKPPAEASITATQFGAVVNSHVDGLPASLLKHLEAVVPGITAYVALSDVAQSE